MTTEGGRAYIHIICPDCGTDTIGRKEPNCDCGRALPSTFVIPYETEWDYSEDLVAILQQHSGLRLMGRCAGRDSENIDLLNHAEYLYLSRYPKFTFSLLASFSALEVLELDLTDLRSLKGIGRVTSLRSFTATECKKLESIDDLADVPNLTVLDLALCNKINDLSPAATCTLLKGLRFEGRELRDIQFTGGMASLKTAVLNCTVKSGDLTPLEGTSIQRLVIRKRAFEKPMIKHFRLRMPNCQIELI